MVHCFMLTLSSKHKIRGFYLDFVKYGKEMHDVAVVFA